MNRFVTFSLLKHICLSLLIITLLPIKCDAGLHVDTSYEGRYRATRGYAQILADLPYVYQEAFEKIERSLGIAPRPRMTVIVVFSDKLMFAGFRLRGKRRSVITIDNQPVHYIHLDLEFLMEGESTLIEEMTHELTHAIMADIMGLNNYDILPMWIKEGTAVHTADQGLARIKTLTKRGFSLDAFAVENECQTGNPISLEKYVEHYLKIEFLHKTFGRKALHNFVAKLMKSGDVAGELSACFNGLTEDVMNQYAADFIKETLLDNARPITALENLDRGKKSFSNGEYLSARLALTEALYGGLPDSLFQQAAYLLAECYIQERNPHSAFELLTRFNPDAENVPIDRYEFLSAYSKYAMGLIPNAYYGFKKAFETSTSSAIQEGSLYYIIRILVELNNEIEALKVLEIMRHNFAGSEYCDLATRVLGYE